jgi:hypothetical protein
MQAVRTLRSADRARVEVHQINRVVDASSAAIDRILIDLKLIDQQGRVTAAARLALSWQCTFWLPTPHLWVKSCLIDSGLTDVTSSTTSLDLRSRPECAA